MNTTDLQSWKRTAIILGVVSIAMFVIQRSSFAFLDVVFEFCVFHVPAIVSVGIYLYMRRGAAATVAVA